MIRRASPTASRRISMCSAGHRRGKRSPHSTRITASRSSSSSNPFGEEFHWAKGEPDTGHVNPTFTGYVEHNPVNQDWSCLETVRRTIEITWETVLGLLGFNAASRRPLLVSFAKVGRE